MRNRILLQMPHRQAWISPRITPIALAVILLCYGCDRTPPDAPKAPATSPATRPASIASLSPAATDILLGMGARSNLVGISNWDPKDSAVAALPRVGDYQSVDWEKLSVLRPSAIVIQYAPDKMPPGLAERATQLGIAVVNVKINRIDDVFPTIRQLGEAIHEPALADDAEKRLRAKLDGVKARVAGEPKVRTLISSSSDPLSLAGPGNFLDELLTIAGGTNVKSRGNDPYPKIDREELAALDPDAVLQLMPQASPQVRESAGRFWESMPGLSAVKNSRVYRLTEPYLLLPGYCIGDIAETFASKLHPSASAGPSTKGSQ